MNLHYSTYQLPIALVAILLLSHPTAAVEHILFNEGGHSRQVSGNVIVEDDAGSVLLETDDGAMWPIQANTINKRTSDREPLVPLTKKQLAERLLKEMGDGFQVHDSKHYIVVFNTTRTYAQWCSSLLEKLQKGFISYWKKRGCDVKSPENPLAVLIFSDKKSYARYANAELGGSVGNAIGYYSFQTNRIVMYDLTGSQELRVKNSKRGTLHDITKLLNQPAAEPLVATIVHEATHQISYNCGLQVRYNFSPVWLSEGLAVYFETPDLSNRRGGGAIGAVNRSRWNRFRKSVRSGNEPKIKNLIVSDDLIRNPRTAVDAYAAAWAWNYFLIKWHTDEYVAYLKALAEKPQLMIDKPQTRLADFREHFGEDINELEKDFFRRMSRIK